MDILRKSIQNFQLMDSGEQSVGPESQRSVCRSREDGGNAEPPAKRRVINPGSSMAEPTGVPPRLSIPQREEGSILNQSMPLPHVRLYVPGSSGSVSEISMPSIDSGLGEQTRYLSDGSFSSASQNRREPTTAEDLERLHDALNIEWETINNADVITADQATKTLDLTAQNYSYNIRRFCYSMTKHYYQLVADPKNKAGIKMLCKQAEVLSCLKEKVVQVLSDALMGNQLSRLNEQEESLNGKMRELYCFLWWELFVSLDSLVGVACSIPMPRKNNGVNSEGLKISIGECHGVLELGKTLKEFMPRAVTPSDDYLRAYIERCKGAVGTNHPIHLPIPHSNLFDTAGEQMAYAKSLL